MSIFSKLARLIQNGKNVIINQKRLAFQPNSHTTYLSNQRQHHLIIRNPGNDSFGESALSDDLSKFTNRCGSGREVDSIPDSIGPVNGHGHGRTIDLAGNWRVGFGMEEMFRDHGLEIFVGYWPRMYLIFVLFGRRRVG